jgi:hypothetical protein
MTLGMTADAIASRDVIVQILLELAGDGMTFKVAFRSGLFNPLGKIAGRSWGGRLPCLSG